MSQSIYSKPEQPCHQSTTSAVITFVITIAMCLSGIIWESCSLCPKAVVPATRCCVCCKEFVPNPSQAISRCLIDGSRASSIEMISCPSSLEQLVARNAKSGPTHHGLDLEFEVTSRTERNIRQARGGDGVTIPPELVCLLQTSVPQSPSVVSPSAPGHPLQRMDSHANHFDGRH